MRAFVDRDACISCGLCATICPEVFEMDDEDIATVIADPVPAEHEDAHKRQQILAQLMQYLLKSKVLDEKETQGLEFLFC